GWTIQSSLTGEDFINFFNFDSGQSDNDGVANYVDGVTEGLVYTNSDGQVVIAVDTTEYVSLRNSVRMVSATTFNPSTSSLFIFDVEQIPAVCGVWPAIWFTGTDWPADGEIDVVEGVNEYTQNIFSIHTGDDCTMDTSLLTDAALVDAGETDCNAYVSDTACGAMSNSTASYGVGSNSAGGSVYALQLTSAGLEMYWWTKDSVPADITSGLPTPSTWGSPAVEVLSDTCDTDSHFIDLMMIVNTNLGGTFPEGVWSTDDAGGQDTSCATLTSYSDAASYIQNVGSAFSTAQWV
ncbi:glycoside hydrolase family 16 protein, partial [Fistulina hepatica ATCC 64428]